MGWRKSPPGSTSCRNIAQFAHRSPLSSEARNLGTQHRERALADPKGSLPSHLPSGGCLVAPSYAVYASSDSQNMTTKTTKQPIEATALWGGRLAGTIRLVIQNFVSTK